MTSILLRLNKCTVIILALKYCPVYTKAQPGDDFELIPFVLEMSLVDKIWRHADFHFNNTFSIKNITVSYFHIFFYHPSVYENNTPVLTPAFDIVLYNLGNRPTYVMYTFEVWTVMVEYQYLTVRHVKRGAFQWKFSVSLVLYLESFAICFCSKD